jgi:hypothetical protein
MKAKPFLIVTVSLLIGIIVGILISAQLRHKRMRSVRELTSERYFRDVLYKVIEPTEDLKKQLEPIIVRYGKEGRELQKEFRRTFEAHNDQYWKEIKALLSDEQLHKLNEFNRKRLEERKRFHQDTLKSRRGGWDRNRPDSGPSHRPQYNRSRQDSLKSRADTSIQSDTIN